MNLNITGHHLEVTPSLRAHALEKFGKIKRHFEQVITVHIILSVEKRVQKAEATLHLCGKDVFAECKNDDLYVAIEQLVDTLDRQVRKHKDKVATRRYDTVAITEVPADA